jgi:two-component system, OmpR family, sensor histidine kinase BaeS
MKRLVPSGIAVRVAVACLLVVALAVVIIGAGVLEVARAQFEALMMKHGASSADANSMFEQTVSPVFAAAVLVAILLSALVAILLARYISRPLEEVGAAAGRLARGDWHVRAAERGPVESRLLAKAFNSMADSLEGQEEARREFVTGAAHELLTPLTTLQGYLEGLRDGVVHPSPAVYASLHEEADRLVRLARALLDLADAPSRNEPPRSVELRAAVESTVGLVAPALDRSGMEVDVTIEGAMAVRAKPDHLTQVLFNLLQNAGRYGEPGAHISVQAERLGDVTRVSVINSGPTIPEADLPHVFERFYRVDKSRDRSSGGHGLGLALVKQLVEADGGDVGATSAGNLTTVWFTLPTG